MNHLTNLFLLFSLSPHKQRYKAPSSTSRYLHDYVNSMSNNNGNNGNGSSNDDSMNSISHVIKDIQNLSMNSGNHYHYLNHKTNGNGLKTSGLNAKNLNGGNTNAKLGLDTLSKDSGVQSNGDVDSDSDGAMTSSSTTTTSSTANLPGISYVIQSLSSNTISVEERLKSMKDLTELIKAGNRPEYKWNENFKNILFCLFNHLDYDNRCVLLSQR